VPVADVDDGQPEAGGLQDARAGIADEQLSVREAAPIRGLRERADDDGAGTRHGKEIHGLRDRSMPNIGVWADQQKTGIQRLDRSKQLGNLLGGRFGCQRFGVVCNDDHRHGRIKAESGKQVRTRLRAKNA